MPTTQNHSQRPLISFIVTTFNLPEEYLQTCISRLFTLSLTAKEREIIVVDDGSATPAINELNDYFDEIFYILQPHGGLSEARNTGLRMARGQYIQFVDGDDFLITIPYNHCLDIMRYHQPDLVVFDATTSEADDDSSATPPFSIEGPMNGSTYMYNHNLRASVCGYIFRKDIIGKLRFNVHSTTEDEEFTPQLILRAETLYATASKAYFYRQRATSLTHNTQPEACKRRIDDSFRVICTLQDRIDTLPEQEGVALKRRIAQLSMDYLYNVIRYTHDAHALETAIGMLRNRNLFPLPDKPYTRKYVWFRKLVASRIGRKILLVTIR